MDKAIKLVDKFLEKYNHANIEEYKVKEWITIIDEPNIKISKDTPKYEFALDKKKNSAVVKLVDDIKKLLDVLHKLVDKGNTVLVIEHNMDVIKTADNIIDIGPEGGEKGGKIVVQGSPQTVAACSQSHTGFYLKQYLPKTESV